MHQPGNPTLPFVVTDGDHVRVKRSARSERIPSMEASSLSFPNGCGQSVTGQAVSGGRSVFVSVVGPLLVWYGSRTINNSSSRLPPPSSLHLHAVGRPNECMDPCHDARRRRETRLTRAHPVKPTASTDERRRRCLPSRNSDQWNGVHDVPSDRPATGRPTCTGPSSIPSQ